MHAVFVFVFVCEFAAVVDGTAPTVVAPQLQQDASAAAEADRVLWQEREQQLLDALQDTRDDMDRSREHHARDLEALRLRCAEEVAVATSAASSQAAAIRRESAQQLAALASEMEDVQAGFKRELNQERERHSKEVADLKAVRCCCGVAVGLVRGARSVFKGKPPPPHPPHSPRLTSLFAVQITHTRRHWKLPPPVVKRQQRCNASILQERCRH